MARCLDVLRVLSPNERDLIRLIVEIVHEIRDEAIPEREEEMVGVRISLHICILTTNFSRLMTMGLLKWETHHGLAVELLPPKSFPRKSRHEWSL